MTDRNTTPEHIWEALRRLYNCNKTQLAARLGVSSRTLRRWEEGEASDEAHRKAADLLQTCLRAANADTHAQSRINRPAIPTIRDSL